MKLSKLLEAIEIYSDIPDCDIIDVVIDTRKVKQGSLFVAIKGETFDGHNGAMDALRQGAAAVVVERRLEIDREILVDDTRKANALLSAAYFDYPGKKLKLIGVTGTNGKTTTASMIKQAIESTGHPAGLIGTIQCEIKDRVVPAKYTTPEPWDLNALLASMVAAGCEYAVMEASSQALAQQRLYGQVFEVGVFTNLTQDHLDYHKTMERYFEAKKMLFDMSKTAVVNLDDPYGRVLSDELSIPVFRYSDSSNEADYTAKNPEYNLDGVKFAVSGDGFIGRVKVPVPGHFSVLNALAAVTSLIALGFKQEEACMAVSSMKGIKGRSELIHQGDITVISDFAHTADALKQLLTSLKPLVAGRMIVVFGCAGDRDAGKREEMVRVVCESADLAVLTSDNPRTEDPALTIESLLPLFAEEKIQYHAEPDRERAITWALQQCKDKDLVVLCGKGHEEYQVMDGYTAYFNEKEIVNRFFS